MPIAEAVKTRHGTFQVLYHGPADRHGLPSFYCRCECGSETCVPAYLIEKGAYRRCVDCRRKAGIESDRATDLHGRVFERLTVRGLKEYRPKGQSRWLCECACGNVKEVGGQTLESKHARSCGCITKELQREKHWKHGMIETRTYSIWMNMIARCYYPKAKQYEYYGGSGITVCDRWRESFVNFLEDMGEVPEGHSIDRKDSKGNYETDNCKWSTTREQLKNRDCTVFVEYKGERVTISELADIAGLPYSTTYGRYAQGWSPERIVSTPPKKSNGKRASTGTST